MKQSIRPTRATLYFQFIALRDLTPVRAGAPIIEGSKSGKDMVTLTLKCGLL